MKGSNEESVVLLSDTAALKTANKSNSDSAKRRNSPGFKISRVPWYLTEAVKADNMKAHSTDW